MMERYTDEVMNPLTANNAKGDLSAKLLSYNEIATKLLSEKLILTALELHAELCETGKELPILRDFFANPNNFESQSIKPEPYVSMARSSSQATLDSLDMTRYSEDGGGIDERVAVLEFELRKAKENISALRANLTVIIESESTSPNKKTDKELTKEHPIKPHELRALNFLVYEYLLAQSYKLTSITFSDENENQDFEDWEDVGLNIPKPPNLLQVYREFFRRNEPDKSSSLDVSVQTDFEDFIDANYVRQGNDELNDITLQVEYLKQRIVSLEQEKVDMERCFEKIDGQIKCVTYDSDKKIHIHSTVVSDSTTPDKFEIVESLHRTSQDADEDDSMSAVLSIGDTDPGDKDWMKIQLPKIDTIAATIPILDHVINQPSRFVPIPFKQQILAYAQINTADTDVHTMDNSIDLVGTRDSLVDSLAASLPVIVPNIILNKREEIIPLVLNTIRLHSESSQRDRLLELLFNLKKKPQQDERRILLRALVSAVKTSVVPLEPEDILTVCWEQSQHRYTERRLLAVECCSALAPYTSSAVRNSLVISMLQQMLLDDKESAVRAAVIHSLALYVVLTDDPDKYFQCEELAMAALDDISFHVSDAASTILLPTLAQWALSLKRLLSHLLSRVISKLKVCLQHTPSKDHNSGDRAMILINVLKILLPHMIVCIVNSSTVIKSMIVDKTPSELPQQFLSLSQSDLADPRVFLDDLENIGRIFNTFLINNIGDNDIWPELEWLNTKLLPDMLEIIKIVDLSQEKVIDSLLLYLQSLCNGFGHQAVQSRIRSIFELQVMELEKQLMALSDNDSAQTTISPALIPAYLVILSTFDIPQFANTLKHFVIVLSISNVNITSLTIAIRLLCNQPHSVIIEHVLAALWNGVVHQRAIVRNTTARLFGDIVGNVEERLVISRVAPAIITLASDSDIMVKAAAITAVGKLITDCSAKEVQDKGRLTLESIVREAHGVPQALTIPLISTFANITTNCPQHYIEDIIVTQLTGITASALQQTQNVHLTTTLLDAYSTLVYSSLSDECITGVLLPGLKYLETLVNHILPSQKENVRSLIREAELRQSRPKPTERSSSASSGLSLTLTTVNVGQGVEDMRQRMTKIFTPKSNSPSMANIFRKK